MYIKKLTYGRYLIHAFSLPSQLMASRPLLHIREDALQNLSRALAKAKGLLIPGLQARIRASSSAYNVIIAVLVVVYREFFKDFNADDKWASSVIYTMA